MVEPEQSGSLARRDVVNAIGVACRQWGFFQVVDHGIPAATQAAFIAAMRAFFALPSAAKREVKRTVANSRGFADDELTKQRQDLKELFDLGHTPRRDLPPDHEANRVLDGHNQWPAEGESLVGFQAACEAYYDAAAALATELMGAVAESLGLSPTTFEAALGANHTSYLRLNWYPLPDALADLSGSSVRGDAGLGISRHTDAGALTVLLQEGPSALEVYSGTKEDRGDGAWVAVDPVPGALTINIGDMLQVWSNGLFAAPEHRVQASSAAERFSAPFFFNPSYDATVEPLPTLLDPAHAAHVARILASPVTRTSGAGGAEGVAAAAAAARAPAFGAINWGHFRHQRFLGDFADRGKEIQIEDYLLAPTAASGRGGETDGA